MMRSVLTAIWGLAWILISAGFAADIRINEIMAAPSERLVRWPADGPPRVGTGVPWQAPAFDSTHWRSAPGPFGYGFEDIRTDLEREMRGITPSLYLRIHFQVSAQQAASDAPLKWIADYNDGYVAHLNGREIARRNLGGTGSFVCHDQPAFNARFGAGDEETEVGAAKTLLRDGDNVLAVQVHDRGQASDVRFKFQGALQLESGQPAILVSSTAAWEYWVGVSEPSGGVADPSVAGHAEFCDWIELFNPSGESVSLEGWSLSNRAGNTNRWVFPSTTLPSGGYLLVLASGQDVRDPGAPFLHTNFKLDADGEYLGLFDNHGLLVHQLGTQFPRQVFTHSYGWDPLTTSYRYFEDPSPGRENGGARFAGILERPGLSLPPGFQRGPVHLSITVANPDAIIRFTTNGTEPTLTNGTLYSGPVELVKSTALRARAFKGGWIPSDTITRTFLIDEPEALQSLSAVSLVADPERCLYPPHGVTTIVGGTSMFGAWRALGPADYNIPMQQGRPYMRPVSMEIIHPSQGSWAQADLDLGMAGSAHTRGHYRLLGLPENPWYGSWEDKPSFNLFFHKEYGPDRLDFPMVPGYDAKTFHSLKLRSGKVDWNNPFLIDEFVRRVFIDMGQVGSMGILANLFVNGEFKCYYNLVERLRGDFFQERHGSGLPWDVISDNVAEEGDSKAWESMLSYIRDHDMQVLDQYQTASQQLDMVNFIDYLLVNVFGGNWDWPQQNYMAARERSPQAPYRFYVWDAEAAMDTHRFDPASYDKFKEDLRAAPGAPIPDLYQTLSRSSEFRLLFADRIQRHFFNNGALTEPRLKARLAELADALDPVMRFVRDGAPVDRAGLLDWIERRRSALFTQFASEKLWPSVLAPLLNQQGGEVPVGFEVDLSNPNPQGTIYFTQDGTDPRAPDNSPHGTVYTKPIVVEALTLVKARVLGLDGWSPLSEARFTARSEARLVISEIMYHPPDSGNVSGTSLEFIELKNVGDEVAYLSGFQFTDGIAYTFPLETTLAHGDYLVLASDTAAFADRYGGLRAFGQFLGNLANNGERIALSDSAGRETLAFSYDDHYPWPVSPDGGGYSLVLADDSRIADGGLPASWRASLRIGGSPGQQDPASALIRVSRDGVGIVLTWNNLWILQTSHDLEAWTDISGATSPLTVSISSNTKTFWRLRSP